MSALVVSLALVVAACGTPGAEDGSLGSTTSIPATTTSTTTSTTTTTVVPAPTPPPETITSGDLEVIVVPVDGQLPADLMVQCPGGPAFPFGAISEIPRLDEADPQGLLEAIAPFLANEEGQLWPQTGWRLLHDSDDEAVLVTPTEDGSLAYMFLTRDGNKWDWSGSSISGNRCDLQYTVPEGLHTVEWELDPEGPELTPDTTELHVMLTERDCASGLEIGDRLLGPQVVMTDESVHIAFAAEAPSGDFQTCPGIAPVPHVVQLPAPLGDREVVPNMNVGHTLEDYLG